MRRWTAFILFLWGAMCISGDTLRGTYTYTYGDSESLIDARQTCKNLAVRDAIESYYVFVESSTEVENAMLKEDIIKTLSAGYLKNLTVVEETEEGRTLSTTVEAEVVPEEVQALVKRSSEKETEQPVDTTAGASLAQETPETLKALLKGYESRMNEIDVAWNQKDYGVAYNGVQDMQKKLEAHIQKGASPFEQALYLCVHRRTLLVKHAIGLEQAQSQGHRKGYARDEAKQVIQDAVLLKAAMNRLESVKTSDDEAKALRSVWLKRCQNMIDRVKHKNPVLRNR